MAPTPGYFVTETFGYHGGRPVTVYVPPGRVESILYAADGGWHISWLGDVLADAGATSTMIVGVHGTSNDQGRLREYSPGFDPERFAAHESFVVDDVRHWVQTRFGIALPPERTAVWGASIGGEFALAMGMRHADIFGVVLAASPGGGYRPPEPLPGSLPRVYLVAGTQEPFFVKNAARWKEALLGGGADVVMTERIGAHGDAFWREEVPLMLAWAFGQRRARHGHRPCLLRSQLQDD